MRHSFEIELREVEGREPMLHGTILQEGRAGFVGAGNYSHRGASGGRVQGIEIMPEHRGTVESRAHPIRSRHRGTVYHGKGNGRATRGCSCRP